MRLRFVFGDHLTRSISALRDAVPGRDAILMAEVMEEAGYAPHHKQKLAFCFAAMRRFAQALRAEGFEVLYRRIDEPAPARSFSDALLAALPDLSPERVIVTEPGEWRVLEMIRAWEATLPCPVEIRPDDRFFTPIDAFRAWAGGRSSLRMEYFYRWRRREDRVLMDGEEPAGGRWNFDAENRKALPRGWRGTPPPRFAPDDATREVIETVARLFPDNFGDLDGFGWAIDRRGALEALDWFIAEALPEFGDYQDAMKRGDPFLRHSALSVYLNAGLLEPREVVAAAEAAYRAGRAPLNSAEGFVRQILGWREYVRGVYWTRMPDYARTNALAADRPLPWFYWSGETDMACVKDVVEQTRRNAYAHHIQRLMVTGKSGSAVGRAAGGGGAMVFGRLCGRL